MTSHPTNSAEVAGLVAALTGTMNHIRQCKQNGVLCYPNLQGDADTIELAIAALRSAAPEGWVLVPREPTEEMVSEGYSKITTDIEVDSRDLYEVWKAMLAAAPAKHDAKAGGEEV